ncbi:hypothetical protein TV01_1843 [Neisseria flavescens]|nr:hypothetical protein TV01_1843 [Neisseria flavescens]
MPSEKARIERFALFVVWEMCKDALLKLTVNFQNLATSSCRHTSIAKF